MINLRLIRDTGILYCKAKPPMTVLELQQLNSEIYHEKYPGITLDTPQLIDVSSVNLLDYSAEEIKAAVWNRAAFRVPRSKAPMSVIVREGGSFGMARMFAIRYDLAGIRSEDHIHITENRREAVSWLLGAVGQEDLNVDRFLQWTRAAFPEPDEMDYDQPHTLAAS